MTCVLYLRSLGQQLMLVGVATQPASAGKGTEFDQFVKRLKKFADDDYALTPKGFCVCQDGSLANQSRVGALGYEGQVGDPSVRLLCLVRFFGPDGAATGTGVCDTFEILSK